MARVLIVDDEKSIRLTLREFLRHDGYDVSIAADADEATALLGEQEFDVVVTDLILPRVTGVELLRRIRALRISVQVIVMTGEPTVETASEAVRAGAFDYVSKPISKDIILKTVANAARVKALDDEKKALEEDNRRYRETLERLVTDRTRALKESNVQLQQAMDELKHTQLQIIQQERLRALGEMASGIAHDFNNILAVIQGFSSILLKNPEQQSDEAKLQKYLEMINTAAVDGAKVVSRMREFYRSREATETFNKVDLNELVPKAIMMTQPKWKDLAQADSICVRVLKELDESVPPIFGNEAELREILTNLIINAVDAVSGEGCITVRTKREGDLAVLEVSDDGRGMEDEVARRCFEPFFTTKGDRGTGMGLAVTHGVVRRHDGTITVHSIIDEGTTFRIAIPVLNRTAKREAPIPTGPATIDRSLQILVADDEERIRILLRDYLAADGHQVTMTKDGREAIEAFSAQPFDVVITDRAMPDVSGDLVAKAVKDSSPGTPVIMVTGFGRLMTQEKEIPPGVDIVLTKPVEQDDLLRAIARALSLYQQESDA